MNEIRKELLFKITLILMVIWIVTMLGLSIRIYIMCKDEIISNSSLAIATAAEKYSGLGENDESFDYVNSLKDITGNSYSNDVDYSCYSLTIADADLNLVTTAGDYLVIKTSDEDSKEYFVELTPVATARQLSTIKSMLSENVEYEPTMGSISANGMGNAYDTQEVYDYTLNEGSVTGIVDGCMIIPKTILCKDKDGNDTVLFSSDSEIFDGKALSVFQISAGEYRIRTLSDGKDRTNIEGFLKADSKLAEKLASGQQGYSISGFMTWDYFTTSSFMAGGKSYCSAIYVHFRFLPVLLKSFKLIGIIYLFALAVLDLFLSDKLARRKAKKEGRYIPPVHSELD